MTKMTTTMMMMTMTMTKRLLVMMSVLALVMFAGGAPVLAHAGHEHKIMGTLTMAMADHVTVKDKDDKEVTVKVTKDTKVKARPAIKVEEIKAGTRVVVTVVEEKDKTLTAKTIEIGTAPAAQ
jgi:hypothetical protein